MWKSIPHCHGRAYGITAGTRFAHGRISISYDTENVIIQIFMNIYVSNKMKHFYALERSYK